MILQLENKAQDSAIQNLGHLYTHLQTNCTASLQLKGFLQQHIKFKKLINDTFPECSKFFSMLTLLSNNGKVVLIAAELNDHYLLLSLNVMDNRKIDDKAPGDLSMFLNKLDIWNTEISMLIQLLKLKKKELSKKDTDNQVYC